MVAGISVAWEDSGQFAGADFRGGLMRATTAVVERLRRRLRAPEGDGGESTGFVLLLGGPVEWDGWAPGPSDR